MKTLAVIGRDIGYSLSPIIHNALFLDLKLKAKYELLNIDNLENNINRLLNLSGFNVTIPYKEDIMKYCQELSPEAKKTGAVNCVKVENNEMFGYNTDVFGFYMVLKKYQLQLQKKKVLVIGAGGSGKAVYYCLSNYTNHDIVVTNRTMERAKLLTDNVVSLDDVKDCLNQFDIVINCTNVGVKTNDTPIIIENIKKDSTFIDINYQNKSKFLLLAEKLNAKTINGYDMLIYQAAKSFEIWFNQEANLEIMNQAIGRK